MTFRFNISTRGVVSVFLVFFLSGCVLRQDDFYALDKSEIKSSGKIKRDYISLNSWNVEDTKASVAQIMKKMSSNKRFNEILKKRGVVKVKLGFFRDRTQETGFQIDDIKNELLAEISNNDNIVLIEEDNDSLVKELSYQQDGMVKKSDRKNIGHQSGADLLIFGDVSISKAVELSNITKNYFATFRISDIQSGERLMMSVYKTTKKYTIE